MTKPGLHMAILSRGVRVHSDEEHFHVAIREAFPHLEIGPGATGDGPDTTLDYHFSVGTKSDLFVDSLGDPIAHSIDFNLYHWKDSLVVSAGARSFARCLWNDMRVEVTVHPDDRENDWVVAHRLFFLPLLEWMRREGHYPLHAAGFQVAGMTVLVSGPSGSGKSTSSLAALAAGAPFLTDDTLFVSRDRTGALVLNPFPEPVKIGQGSARWFPNWHDDFVTRNGKFTLPEEKLPGGGRLTNCAPGLLLFPSFSNEPITKFDPMTRAEAMVRLLPQSAIPSSADVLQSHMNLLGDLVEASEPHFFRFAKDVPDLVGHIERLIRAGEYSD